MMHWSERLYRWSQRQFHEHLLHRHGGIQKCPYCQMVMQESSETRSRRWPADDLCDEYTCGICGGVSVWKFELGMFYVGEMKAPEPKFDRWFDHPGLPPTTPERND